MNEKLPPENPNLRPMEYWHAAGPPTLHPVLLTLCTSAGTLVGAVVAIAVGIFPGFLMADKGWTLCTGILIDLSTMGLFIWLFRKIRSGRSMAIEDRRAGSRFFVIGLLLGSGLACLAEGICYTAFGANR